MKKVEIHKLGVDISKVCKWNGKDITKVYLEALTNSNFHTFRRKVTKSIKDIETWNLILKG